jgi:hypothetical protein
MKQALRGAPRVTGGTAELFWLPGLTWSESSDKSLVIAG